MSSVGRLVALVSLLLSVAFAIAPGASATSYWQHYGWDPSGYDGSCTWYATSARCSGWNNWSFVEGTIYSGGPVLVGFENYQRIRGQYAYAGDYREVDPYMLGMCCYLIAHGTNTAVPAWVSLWAASP
jgi:hypothetical protein